MCVKGIWICFDIYFDTSESGAHWTIDPSTPNPQPPLMTHHPSPCTRFSCSLLEHYSFFVLFFCFFVNFFFLYYIFTSNCWLVFRLFYCVYECVSVRVCAMQCGCHWVYVIRGECVVCGSYEWFSLYRLNSIEWGDKKINTSTPPHITL